MWDSLNGFLLKLYDVFKAFPKWSIGMIIVMLLALFMAASLLMEGSEETFIQGLLYVAVTLALSVIASTRDSEFWRGNRLYRNIVFVSPVALGISGFLFLTWFSLTAHRYVAEYDLFCSADLVDDQIERDQSFFTSVLRTVFGIDETNSKCSASKFVITWTAEPLVTYRKGNDQDISTVHPFSHRRSSCNGSSSSEFIACMPVGASVSNIAIKELPGRNGGIRPYKSWEDSASRLLLPIDDTRFIEIRETIQSDGNKQNCAVVPWFATSGGRTGIGECRYHGLVNFEVLLSGKINVETEQTVLEKRKPVPKHISGTFIREFISFPQLEEDIGAISTSYLEGNLSVEVEYRRKHHTRDYVVWRDLTTKQKDRSTCVNLELSEYPFGFFVENKCFGDFNAEKVE